MIDLESRVPSLAQVRDVYVAFWTFEHGCTGRSDTTWKQEDRLLPLFTNLADVLRPVRPLLDSTEGWVPRVGRALRRMAEEFDKIAGDWGWEPLARPEPDRSQFKQQREELFRQEVARPMYQAAITYQDKCYKEDRECPSDIERHADRGRREGFEAGPDMPFEECRAAFAAARENWWSAPRMGRCFPFIDMVVDAERHGRMCDALNRLTSAFDDEGLGRLCLKWLQDYALSTAPNAVKTRASVGEERVAKQSQTASTPGKKTPVPHAAGTGAVEKHVSQQATSQPAKSGLEKISPAQANTLLARFIADNDKVSVRLFHELITKLGFRYARGIINKLPDYMEYMGKTNRKGKRVSVRDRQMQPETIRFREDFASDDPVLEAIEHEEEVEELGDDYLSLLEALDISPEQRAALDLLPLASQRIRLETLQSEEIEKFKRQSEQEERADKRAPLRKRMKRAT